MTGSDVLPSTSHACAETLVSLTADSTQPLRDKTVVELGAGTEIVGILASYYGSKSIITDFDSLVPLIRFNIDQNVGLIRGSAVGQPLCWGDTIPSTIGIPDYLVLANCVYYESSLEPLLETVLELTDQRSVVLACYEERTPEIKGLVGRWHDLVEQHFELEEVDKRYLQNSYWKEYVRVVLMRRREIAKIG